MYAGTYVYIYYKDIKSMYAGTYVYIPYIL